MYQTSRTGWSEWSDWIWNDQYGQHYRQRLDASGNTQIQWQVEYESTQNNQIPRTPVDQMTQQFQAVNLQSPEYTVGDEQNSSANIFHGVDDEYSVTGGSSSRSKSKSSSKHSRSSKSKSSKSRPSKSSGGKGKGPAQEDIGEDDEQDDDGQAYHHEAAAGVGNQTYYDPTTGQYYQHQQNAQADPSLNQHYVDGSAEQEDTELQAAIEQSRQYAYDPYRRGEPSSAYVPSSAYDAYEDEEDQSVSASIGNSERIVGTAGEAETLDPRYRVAHSQSFQPGEVFKVLWPEPAGGGGGAASIAEETILRDRYGGRIYVHFRRFIVIANDLGHSTCIPIATYGRKGCKKAGIKAEQHGIVYESNRKPVSLPGEPKLGYPPIRLHIHEQGERISQESRVNYSKLTTVEHNVKVLFIGRVVGADWDIVTEAVNTSWANKTHKKKHRR
ncbi:hypothetical protein F66182_10430 [Fusarium sp. NRRL 66182]|nr:hypothetical protein F66182_10430 [Fusarium sp. NRRL 66182]